MPIWLFFSITGLSLLTAFKCPKCQEWNRPHSPETASVVEAIRYTPVPQDSIFVMFIRKGRDYYRPIYNSVVKCSGLQDDVAYEELEFYVADAPVLNVNGIPSSAYYEPDSHSVVFALGNAGNSKTIAHEILHMLLQKYGLQDPRNKDEDQHPGYWFNDSRKCKGVVYPH